MNNVSHNKLCLPGGIQVHVDLPPVTLIKCEMKKWEKYYIKIILHSNPMSATSDMYEFNMVIF